MSVKDKSIVTLLKNLKAQAICNANFNLNNFLHKKTDYFVKILTLILTLMIIECLIFLS